MNNEKSKSKILIVDDSPMNIDIIVHILSSQYNVIVAKNGESAIKLAEEKAPNLILLDIVMPGLDGYETCKHLKNNEKTKNIPIIFMTGLSETKDVVKGYNVGAVDYITKPVQAEEVIARVKTHLATQFLQKSLTEKNIELEEMNQNLEKLVEQKTKQIINQEKTAIIGRLTQGIVHNFRNPLTAIILYNEMIQKEAESNSIKSTLSFSTNIEKAAKQMNSMIDNLMIKSRMDQKTDIISININNFLKTELEIFHANQTYKNAKKEFEFDDSIGEVKIIYSNLAQVLQNLLQNALDSMWNLKEIKLKIVTRQDEEYIFIDIIDYGCGIEKEKLHKIFDLFYTTKPAKGSEEQNTPTGTGLGLNTCIELLKSFNAKIKVKSEINNGSVFTIIIPKKFEQVIKNNY